MAQYSAAPALITLATVAASGSVTNGNHVTIRTWAATQVARIVEIYMGGMAAASAPVETAARRNSTHGTTPTNVAATALSPFSQAALANYFTTCGSTPSTVGAVTANLLQLGFNAFGGIVRWVAAPGSELYLATATAPNDEISLSSVSGASTIKAHMILEEM